MIAAAALVALTLAAYSNCFSDVFVGFNAVRSIRDNPDIQQLQSLWRAMSLHLTGGAALSDGGTLVRRPVVSLSFAANHALLGPSASSYQTVNVAIHAVAGLVLFGIVRRTVARLQGGEGAGLAFVIAALWLVHPLQTESVTYIPQRAESLMGLFALLTLYGAIRAWSGERFATAWAGVALSASALGMATKETMAVVPIAVWLYDATFVLKSFTRPLLLRSRFYLGLAATWLVVVLLVLATWEDARIDFHPPRLLPYALSQPHVVLHYLRLVFWPVPLQLHVNNLDYWFDAAAPVWSEVLLPLALLAVLLIATVRALQRRHWSGYVGAWFFLFLAPTSTFVATSDVLQEHRMYLALASPIALSVVLATCATGRLTTRCSPGFVRVLRAGVVGVVLVGCVTLTLARNRDYASEFGAYAPNDLPAAHGVLAHYDLLLRRDPEAARRRFESMLALQLPDRWDNRDQPQFHRSRVLNALGVISAIQGRYDQGWRFVDEALKSRPRWPVAECNLGVIDLLRGAPAPARERLAAVVAENPDFVAPRFALGLALVANGETDRAAAYLVRSPAESGRPGETDWHRLVSAPDELRRNFEVRTVTEGVMSPFDYILSLQLRAAPADAG